MPTDSFPPGSTDQRGWTLPGGTEPAGIHTLEKAALPVGVEGALALAALQSSHPAERGRCLEKAVPILPCDVRCYWERGKMNYDYG